MERKLDEIITYLRRHSHVGAAYLFGSTAKGTARNGSDVDIAVLFAEGMSAEERFDHRLTMAMELEDLVGGKVDLIDLEAATPFLQFQVRLTGRVLVDINKKRRVAFEVRTRRDYFDLQPLLERRNRKLIQGLGGKS